MKKRTISLALCAALLSGMTAISPASAASIAPIDSPEAAFPKELLYWKSAGFEWLDAAGMASCMDQETLAALPDASDWQMAIYCSDDTPNYEYAAKNNMRFPLNAIYVADNTGSMIEITAGDRYHTALSADVLQTMVSAYYDSSYEITVAQEGDRYSCVIRDPDCRPEAFDAAQALYAALCETYAVFECIYTQSVLQVHRVFCAGAYYDLNKYPDAAEALTAFAAEYAPDWTPVVLGSFVQLTPSDAETDNAANLEMAQLVYETLGYEIYIEYMNDTITSVLDQRDAVNRVNLVTADLDYVTSYDLEMANYAPVESSGFLLLPEEMADDTIYFTDDVIFFADDTVVRSRDALYDTMNFMAYHPEKHVFNIGCMSTIDPNADPQETQAAVYALIDEYFDDTYTVEGYVVETAPPCYHFTITDPLMRAETYGKAYALSVELSRRYNTMLRYFSDNGKASHLAPSPETCMDDSFASYRYTAFPNALEELTAFTEEYAPDWYVEEVSEQNEAGEWVAAGVRLCPKNASANRPYGTPGEQASVAQLVYEVLGYQVGCTVSTFSSASSFSEFNVDLREQVAADYLGDVTLDGSIDSTDALETLQSYVAVSVMLQRSSITTTQRVCADIDGDGVVSADDALAILSLYVSSMG